MSETAYCDNPDCRVLTFRADDPKREDAPRHCPSCGEYGRTK